MQITLGTYCHLLAGWLFTCHPPSLSFGLPMRILMLISQGCWNELYEIMHMKSSIVNHKRRCKCKDCYELVRLWRKPMTEVFLQWDIDFCDMLKYFVLFLMAQGYLLEHLWLTNKMYLSVLLYHFRRLSCRQPFYSYSLKGEEAVCLHPYLALSSNHCLASQSPWSGFWSHFSSLTP